MARKYSEYQLAFKSLGYTFRLNTMNDSIECNGVRLSDIQAATVESRMFDLDFKSAAGITRNIKRAAGENPYHPIKEWLNGLAWNGEDIFGRFMDCITFRYPAISRWFYWRWFVGAVGKVFSDGVEQNVMLSIDGKQGIGKSYKSSWIVPPSMHDYFVEGGMSPGTKDTKIRIMSNFIWEVGELQGMTKKVDLEALKNTITEKKITVRPPYGKNDIVKPAVCSFIGTVNESGAGFLNDVTGNRRFAVVNIINIDWSYTELDPNQLWAQVVAAYKAGERGAFTPQERSEQATINTEYDTLSHVEQYLFAHYDLDPIGFQNEWLSINEIMDSLEMAGLSKSNQRMNQMELSGILQKYNCQKSRSNAITGQGRATCYNGLRLKNKAKASIPFNP